MGLCVDSRGGRARASGLCVNVQWCVHGSLDGSALLFAHRLHALPPLMAAPQTFRRWSPGTARRAVALLGAAASASVVALSTAAPPTPPAHPAAHVPPAAGRQANSDPLRPEPLPYMLPPEIAALPPLRRIYASVTRPGELRAESTTNLTCTLVYDWPPGAPVDAIVSGMHKNKAVAVLGDRVCTCYLPFEFSSIAQKSLGCARIAAARAGREKQCFPATARVTLAGGRRVRVDALALGDRLSVASAAGEAPSSSPLLGWTHSDALAVRQFVAIAYELHGGASRANTSAAAVPQPPPFPHTLRASPGHYLYTVAGRLIPAEEVVVGDALAAADGSSALVVGVSTALGVGLYNPHPAAGELIVDGLRVSAYTTAFPRTLSHVALAPVRAAAAAGVVDPLGRLWPAVVVADQLVTGIGEWLTTAGARVADGMVAGLSGLSF